IILSSIAFFIRKAGDFSRPYDDQWLAPDWRDYLAACDANRAKQFAQAEALLKPLVDDDKVAVRLRVAAMRRLADALDGQGKTSEIPGLAKTFMQYYDQASCSDHLMSITNSFKRAGLWDDAQRIYERVEQLPGTHIDQVIRSIIAQAYQVSRQGDSEKALTILARAWQRHTNSTGTKEVPRIYWHEGMYHENLGRLDQAIAAYQQAIEAATPGSNLYDVATQHLNACIKKRDEQAHDTIGLKSRLRQVKSALSGLKQRLLN
ncbi:MAG TPA: tetratricopeptide repeat protein, partial [Chroococcidiopsis sp.]